MGNPRIFLFVALGFISLLLWQEWQQAYGPQPLAAPVSRGQAPNTPPVNQAGGGTAPSDSNQEELPALSRDSSLTAMPATVSGGVQPSAERAAAVKKIHVLTDKLEVFIDPQGGEISAVYLRAYPAKQAEPEVPFELLHKEAGRSYVAQSGLLSRQSAPSHLQRYAYEKNEYRLAEGEEEIRVPLSWQSGTGLKVSKTIVFRRGTHVIDIEYQLDNQSDTAWQGRQYRQLVRTPSGEGGSALMAAAFNGAAYYSEKDKFEKISFEDIDDNPLSVDVKGGWVAMLQHYFISAWIPAADEINQFYTRKIKSGGRYAIGMISSEIRVDPGQRGTFTSRFYAGPKEQSVLEDLATGLRLTVDYSWLTIIAQPIFWLLTFIHDNVVDNWGWSIVILTLLIKLMFFKLSEYGYRSMANMRRVQPKLMSIKERYGNDKQQMQKAMMDLYKKEKINPMSGCFPILLQIPVFIALYWVLLESVELRQAPFILWITDLSVADPYFVLPLIMGITMYLQQKLNPAPLDETQKMIMKYLPFVFTIFFLFFPAGLVLYWVVNNILSITQQWIITRRIEGGSVKS